MSKIIPEVHQIEGAVWALSTLRKYYIAYLAWEARTGKTITAILTAEYSKADNILVVTKKSALEDWQKTLDVMDLTKTYTLINYDSLHKLPQGTYGLIIIDEAHYAIASVPKLSLTWKKLAKFTKGKPLLLTSATPYAEHMGQIYPQLKLSSYTPFKDYPTFYSWHRTFGIPDTVYTPYGAKESYSKYKTEQILSQITHLLSFKTRAEAGIEHEPIIVMVPIKPTEYTIQLFDDLDIKSMIKVGDAVIWADSHPKVRSMHYQIEGGTMKVDSSTSIRLGNTEKIDYIKTHYPSNVSLAIMAHFIEERVLLKEHFPTARILSSDGDAEGIDLHAYDKLIIYSMSFRASKHLQRIARQANKKRRTPIYVDVLSMDKPGIGKHVYNVVVEKELNFMRDSYELAIKDNGCHTK